MILRGGERGANFTTNNIEVTFKDGSKGTANANFGPMMSGNGYFELTINAGLKGGFTATIIPEDV